MILTCYCSAGYLEDPTVVYLEDPTGESFCLYSCKYRERGLLEESRQIEKALTEKLFAIPGRGSPDVTERLVCVLLYDHVWSLIESIKCVLYLPPLSPGMQVEERLARGQQSCDSLKDRLVSVLLTYIEHSMYHCVCNISFHNCHNVMYYMPLGGYFVFSLFFVIGVVCTTSLTSS